MTILGYRFSSPAAKDDDDNDITSHKENTQWRILFHGENKFRISSSEDTISRGNGSKL